jgi:hypothetical protein
VLVTPVLLRGRRYSPSGWVHKGDFEDEELGVYDVAANTGFVIVGINADPA